MDSVERLTKREMLTVLEISDLLDMQELEDIDTLEEIKEQIEGLVNIQKKYIDIRTELRETIRLENFEQKFPNSPSIVQSLKDEIKRLEEKEEKERLRQEEKEEKKRKDLDKKQERKGSQRNKLKEKKD